MSIQTSTERSLDIILFGATGFTGQYAIPFLSKFSKLQSPPLTWGVAGRSEAKLRKVLQECEQETGTFLGDIPLIIANVDDEKSLKEMAQKARIVLNCCGPYRFYGEQVVKACIEEGTHHLDVSGEPYYMENMQLKYHAMAREKGVYIISACGFDSIPADLGVVFLEKAFQGTLNSVTLYIQVCQEDGVSVGPSYNYATWESVVNGVGRAKDELAEMRKELFKSRLPKCRPKLETISEPHRNNIVNGWSLPFAGADRSVVKRSQLYFYEENKKRPIQVERYITFDSYWNVMKTQYLGHLLFPLIANCKIGRKLLLKYPEKFSAGIFSHEPPKKDKLKNICVTVSLYGEGWTQSVPELNDENPVPPNACICAKIQGRNMAYDGAALCLVLAGITVLNEEDKIPSEGGVYPPGYAFAKTSLIEQLNDNNITFNLEFQKSLLVSKY